MGWVGAILGPAIGGAISRENFGFSAMFIAMPLLIPRAAASMLTSRAVTSPDAVSVLQSASA